MPPIPFSLLIPALAGFLFGGGLRRPPRPEQTIQSTLTSIPELRQLLQLSGRQAQRADPLNEAVVTLARNLLPRSSMNLFPSRRRPDEMG